MGASGKMDAEIPPDAREQVSASSCVQLFACWLRIQLSHHVGGEQLLYVHSEQHVSDGGWHVGKSKVSFCRFVLVSGPDD